MKKYIFIFNKIYIILTFVASALSCTGLRMEDGQPGNEEMSFAPELPGSRTKATDTSFETSDEIGIYAVGYDGSGEPLGLELSGNWANNAKGVFDGQNLVVNPPVYWDGDRLFDVYSYYPYSGEIGSVNNFRFDLKTDQRANGFTLSDLMWARAVAVTRDAGAVSLKFTHRLSRLDIRLVKGEYYEGDLPQEAEVRIHNTVTTALMDFETGDVEKAQDVPASSITAHCNAPGSFSAIVVPQKILNQLPLIEVITKDVSYLVSAKFIFESGMRHKVDVILSDNPDKVVINVGGGIEDWN